MSALKGYQVFSKETLPKITNKLAKLKNGQAPKTLFITCSDSRICPNTITNTDFGELFVLRNAGNSLPRANEEQGDGDKGTLEFAVKALKVKEIVVCGHTHCGAVGAVVSGVEEKQMPFLARYLERFEPLKKTIEKQGLDGEKAVEENILFQLENLLSYDFVKEKVESGELELHGWLYTVESGDAKVVKSYEAGEAK